MKQTRRNAKRRKHSLNGNYVVEKNENKMGMFIAFMAMVIIAVLVTFTSYSLVEKQSQYKAREAELEMLIQEQKDRAEELESFSSYTTTKKYVEEVAKEKLGLVYENEIIFKQEDK